MWKLSHEDFYELVSEGFDAAGVDGYLLEVHSLPDDFRVNPEYPESKYLKVLVLEKSVGDKFNQ
jgi:23S rRNA (cytosine1962-C5)-methyltransferase